MSSSKDIAQWLRELTASDRSANDPWTISRRYSTSSELSHGLSADLGQSFSGLGAEIQNQEQSVRANTQGTESSNSGSAGSSGGSGFLHILGDIFPLFGGIASLFGGGGPEPQAELQPYIFPPSIALSGAQPESGNTTSSVSYGQYGLPRSSVAEQVSAIADNAFEPATGSGATPSSFGVTSLSNSFSPASKTSAAAFSSTSSNAEQQIVVQVQAMDSQSFLDRSHDIAQAVRQAMLNSHPVNDVIMDL
jgi:hypothetical protein